MKKISAILAAVILCLSAAGCNQKNSGGVSDGKSPDTGSLSESVSKEPDESMGNSVSDDPIENAEYVVDQYMKYANFEFDESMLKLMTSEMQEQYKDTVENQGHDHGYDEHEENMLSDVSFTADREQSKILESVNIKDEYILSLIHI